MAWTNPFTAIPGTIITALGWNQSARDNLNYLKEHEVPTGALIMFAANVAPTGYLLCDGAAVSRTGYSALFAVISTLYGVGNGTTTFNVPDLRGRIALGFGAGAGLTARSNGQNGGAESHALTTAELAAHHHSVGGHIHDLKSFPYDPPTTSIGGFHMINQSPSGTTGHITTEGASGATDTADTGSGTAGSLMNPYLVVNYIIKT